MSPARFQDDHHQPSRRSSEINGPRPSPLKLNRDSQVIHKSHASSSSSFSSISSSSSSLSLHVSGVAPVQKQQQQQKPIIIYAHSPKIIHTQARDFMALVQKLTGLSKPGDKNKGLESQSESEKDNKNNNVSPSSSGLTTTEVQNNVDVNVNVISSSNSSSSLVSPILNPPKQPYFADIPLFTPNSTDQIFCSPKPFFRFPEFLSPNVGGGGGGGGGGSTSPSVFKFIKELPEY